MKLPRQTVLILAGLAGFASAGLAAEPAIQPAADSTVEARFLGDIRQLTHGGKRAGEGYFSGDGTRIIFQSEQADRNPFYQMYLKNLQTGEEELVSPGHGKTTCGWIHPDGSTVLFASTHLDPEAEAKEREELDRRARGERQSYAWSFDPWYDIFERDLATGTLRNLTDAPGYDAEGSWSPDGRRIGFASNREAYRPDLPPDQIARRDADPSQFMDIYLMNADGSDVRRLTDAPGYDGGPFFSADGRKIVWRRFAPDGASAEVFTMDSDGTGERQITRLGRMSWAPFFHPSGDYILFASNLEGSRNFELFLVDAAGTRNPVRVTVSDGFDGLPAFSPDGRTLAWSSKRPGIEGPQIFLANWNDAEARRALGLPTAAR
jgi:Tol biopolymer transport system component